MVGGIESGSSSDVETWIVFIGDLIELIEIFITLGILVNTCLNPSEAGKYRI